MTVRRSVAWGFGKRIARTIGAFLDAIPRAILGTEDWEWWDD